MKKWSKQEDDKLKKLVASGKSLWDICFELQMSKYLVEKRLLMLGLSYKKESEIKQSQTKLQDRGFRKKYEDAVSIITELEKQLEIKKGLKKNPITISKIAPKLSGNDNEATAVALLSDWHYEETIKPASVNYLNEFNESVANKRIEALFQTIVKYIKLHQKETNISTLVLALLGDFISSNIHDELKEGNSDLPIQAIWKVQNLVASGIKHILDNTDVSLIVPCSPGNHCVDENTEILTDKGFIKAKKIQDSNILASFDKLTGKISFDKVEAVRKFSQKGAYKVVGKHKDEIVSTKHNLVINNNFVPADTFKSGNRDDFRHFGLCDREGVKLTDDELRLITWVVMDGTLVDNAKYVPNSTKKRVQFKLSKVRKIFELKKLLDRMGIDYTFKPATMSGGNVLPPYFIRIYGDEARKIFSMLDNKKLFPEDFINLTRWQLIVILETIVITDGRENGGSIEWSSVEKHNIDLIQRSCILNGIACKYQTKNDLGGFKSKRKKLYVANIYPNGFNLKKPQKITSKFINKEFNFVGVQTKNGTIITRRNGVVNFTGNSRITEKQRVATEHGNSLEWLMYMNLEQYFRGNDRVKFVINEGYHTFVDIYSYSIRFHHGHSIRFAGGVGGIYIPVNKAINQWNKAKKADLDCFGHFHQMKDGGTFISNGSLIGWNAYAIKIKADFEKPKQAFFLVDKKRFVICVRPIILNGNI